MGDLANFLAQQKAKYLEDVKNGKGKEWTVVMGNEAEGQYALTPKHRPL